MSAMNQALTSLLRASGYSCASLPLAETAIAAWMLKSSGLAVPAADMSIAPVLQESLRLTPRGRQWLLSGRATRVPWAGRLGSMVVLASGPDGDRVALVDIAACKLTARSNFAGESRDDVCFDDVLLDESRVAPAGRAVTHEAIQLHGALMRSLQMAGALERALELSVAYAREREQFGRKISQFQAIQHELARLAGEVAVAVAAALSAAGAAARAGDIQAARWAVAAAKLRTSQAAGEGGMIAHQVHGAVGITDEHRLHHATLRLWAWREEYGNEAHWAGVLGRSVLAAGADGFWQTLTQELS
jgi:acyl-CoA dehydrogenase